VISDSCAISLHFATWHLSSENGCNARRSSDGHPPVNHSSGYVRRRLKGRGSCHNPRIRVQPAPSGAASAASRSRTKISTEIVGIEVHLGQERPHLASRRLLDDIDESLPHRALKRTSGLVNRVELAPFDRGALEWGVEILGKLTTWPCPRIVPPRRNRRPEPTPSRRALRGRMLRGRARGRSRPAARCRHRDRSKRRDRDG
jgi:hypothetical protein